MATTFRDKQVTINISDVDAEEVYPERVLVLQHPDWSINVGRGNSTDETLMPQQHNTWFASRVMSRHHATLRADPKEELLFVTDAGSMHGTFINGQKITIDQPYQLFQEDIITFGSQVIRGDDIFPPLKVSIHFAWSENQQISQPKTYPNSFTADYSEEDIPSDISDDDSDDNDEVEIIRESIRLPSVEILECEPIDKANSTPTSSSINSEPSLPSDPTSISVIEVEETQVKVFDVPDEDVEEDGWSQASSVDSDRYSPPLEEKDNNIETADVGHINKPVKSCVTTESSNPITNTRDLGLSNTAMPKAAPVEPKFQPSVTSMRYDAPQPWQPSLFDFNTTGFTGPFGYNVTPQYLNPPALGSYTAPILSPPLLPGLPMCPSPRDPCIEASWLSDIPKPPVVKATTTLPGLGAHMITSCGRKRKVYEISKPESVMSETFKWPTSSEAAGITNEQSKPAEPAREPDQALTDTANTAEKPMSDPQCEIPVNTTYEDSSVVIEPNDTAASIEELSIDEPQRKRIKKTKDAKSKTTTGSSTTSSQIVKYAATAFAGATVGAIGAVFGLAALPPDFFA